MKKIELEIVALSHSITQTHSYAVVLGEVNGLRRLPIVIGGFEAQAIAVALEKMQPSRPLTHDLMKNFLNAFATFAALTVVVVGIGLEVRAHAGGKLGKPFVLIFAQFRSDRLKPFIQSKELRAKAPFAKKARLVDEGWRAERHSPQEIPDLGSCSWNVGFRVSVHPSSSAS